MAKSGIGIGSPAMENHEFSSPGNGESPSSSSFISGVTSTADNCFSSACAFGSVTVIDVTT
jgi:hypothetical protein